MDGCQFSLLLLLFVNVDLLQGQVERGCAGRSRADPFKPTCRKGEKCIELGVKNFTVYVEDHCDYAPPYDYMSVVSRYEGGQLYKYDKVQRKTGKRANIPPLSWSSRHQIPSDHDPQFFAQLFTNSVEIVSMGRKLVRWMYRDVHRIQTELTSPLSLDQVQRAFVYKEYLFLSPKKAVDFRLLYERTGPFDGDINRPGLLREKDVGLIDTSSIPNEHIDRDFLALIRKKCFNPGKYCSLDIKTESLDLQDYPVAFTYDDLVLESTWFQRKCEMLPMYRIRHKKTAPNVIFDFPNIETLVTHGEILNWTYLISRTESKMYNYTRRGLLPIIQPNDPFYNLVKQFTTPAPTTTPRPPPATTTLKPVPAGPAPKFLEIEEDTGEFESDSVIQPPISKNGPAISRLPVVYYMFGYITVHLQVYIM
ncbi:unnamed protein product [Bursaphelenchus xylophilus]|uniref:(pine wood nematode) hypothetical protein n=1 Tax=Bursaphelenchus xylophilus TaxID=6326 RepID=A0A1I7S8P7_BURXY|nr:unnamed protein product [Bursaphelenchus xylophilus]CAG9089369.1 unnamed protein product [Bursaphelenchus xylophilus]